MNPDIQRIAEKWAEGYKDPQVSAYEVIKAALEELSALRDTQEREAIKRKLDEISVPIVNREIQLRTEVKSLRAELARRDEVEKELRDKLSVAEADVQTIISPFLKKEDELEEENASLRSRIGELEDQLEDARNQWLERDT